MEIDKKQIQENDMFIEYDYEDDRDLKVYLQGKFTCVECEEEHYRYNMSDKELNTCKYCTREYINHCKGCLAEDCPCCEYR